MSRTNINETKTHAAPATNQEKKMYKSINIEETILINGVRAADVSDESILEYIREELACGEKVQETIEKGVKSRTLEHIAAEHISNIEKLTAILDGRLEKEADK